MAQYKIIVPKAGSANEHGTNARLYALDEVVDGDEPWKEELMQTFMANGWAVEVKVDAPEEVAQEPETEMVRARNEDGSFKADDPETPDVNEAWQEKPVEEVKKTTKKRGRPKKKEG